MALRAIRRSIWGFSGDRSEHILHRLMPVKQGGLGQLDRKDLKPEFLIVLAGINNSYEAETPAVDSIVEGVKAIVRLAHARKPKAKIILQSLLPAGEMERNTNIVIPVNARLSQLATDPEFAPFVHYLNLYTAFVDQDGKQNTKAFNDNLHPSREGYVIWKQVLVSEIDRLRAQKRALEADPHALSMALVAQFDQAHDLSSLMRRDGGRARHHGSR